MKQAKQKGQGSKTKQNQNQEVQRRPRPPRGGECPRLAPGQARKEGSVDGQGPSGTLFEQVEDVEEEETKERKEGSPILEDEDLNWTILTAKMRFLRF